MRRHVQQKSIIVGSPADPLLLGVGRSGIVFQVTADIALKVYKNPDDESSRSEQQIFERLEKNVQSPNIIRSFRRTPSATFVQYLGGGSLDERLRRHQIRDPTTDRVIDVSRKEPRHLALRWMAEITDGIAELESLGYAHADIRPQNLLLDYQDHLKVADLDSVTVHGVDMEGGQPPYARLLGPDAQTRQHNGTFGKHSPRSEQFALGSIFYYILRGYEVYDDQWFGDNHGPRIVDLLQEKAFPSLDDNDLDAIIQSCWFGEYDSIASLKARLDGLAKQETELADHLDMDFFSQLQDECKEIIEDRSLDNLFDGLAGVGQIQRSMP